MVPCCHWESDGGSSTFGDPFWIRAKKGEELREIKRRIQATLEMPDEEFKYLRFAYHPRERRRPPVDLRDDDEIVSKFLKSFPAVQRNDERYLGDDRYFIALRWGTTERNPEKWQRTFWDIYR